MNAVELGKFIANLRNEKCLTQEELAEKLFIDKKKVSRWECGRSIPEFELLIELSKILDVSLYELSICQRIPKEKLSTNIVNKFKSMKDLRKHKLKKIIVLVIIILLITFFSITTIYTFKHNGTVEIYEIKSLDPENIIEGNYIVTDEYSIFNITNVESNDSKNHLFFESNKCELDIYNNGYRMFKFKKENANIINRLIYNDKKNSINNNKNKLSLKVTCNINNNTEEYIINFVLVKKYDNKIF